MKKENEENTLPEVKNNQETGLESNNQENLLKVVDLMSGEKLPALKDTNELPFDLVAEYWTPEKPGESKLCFFLKIDTRKALDLQTGELIDLECVFFLEQKEDQTTVQTSNGSKRLVGAIQAAGIRPGTPLKVTYKGKKRNKSNSFMSDDWSVKPLIING